MAAFFAVGCFYAVPLLGNWYRIGISWLVIVVTAASAVQYVVSAFSKRSSGAQT